METEHVLKPYTLPRASEFYAKDGAAWSWSAQTVAQLLDAKS
jgi:hypothetical protein